MTPLRAERSASQPISATLVYLYAVVPAASPAAVAVAAGHVNGIDGTLLRTVVYRDLAAVVGEVPAAEFDETPLNRLMQDLAWLGPRAEAHQSVNAQLFTLADAVLPLSFATLFRDTAAVERLLAGSPSSFAQRLHALRGMGEWVLALRRGETQARAAVQRESPRLAALRLEIGAASPGRAYLLRRQEADLVRQECDRLTAEALGALDALLDAAGARRHQERIPTEAQQARDGATEGRVLARVSALVPREGEPRFVEATGLLNQQWAPRGHTLEVTGPWPPYRFASLPLESHAGSSAAHSSARDAGGGREASRGRG